MELIAFATIDIRGWVPAFAATTLLFRYASPSIAHRGLNMPSKFLGKPAPDIGGEHPARQR
jgi:hypothetical protein